MARRPTVGDLVRLSDYAAEEHRKHLANPNTTEEYEAAGGCLNMDAKPPEIGEIIMDEHDDQPYNVKGPRGDEYWYRENEVQLASNPSADTPAIEPAEEVPAPPIARSAPPPTAHAPPPPAVSHESTDAGSPPPSYSRSPQEPPLHAQPPVPHQQVQVSPRPPQVAAEVALQSRVASLEQALRERDEQLKTLQDALSQQGGTAPTDGTQRSTPRTTPARRRRSAPSGRRVGGTPTSGAMTATGSLTPRSRGSRTASHHFFASNGSRPGGPYLATSTPGGYVSKSARGDSIGGGKYSQAYFPSSPKAGKKSQQRQESVIARIQGWEAFAHETNVQGVSAQEMRDRMRRHQHTSPRPQRPGSLADEDGLAPTSARLLAKQKLKHGRTVERGQHADTTVQQPAPRNFQRPPPEPIHSGTQPLRTADGVSHGGSRMAMQQARKSMDWQPEQQWKGGSHAKLVAEDTRTPSGLHTSWAELQRYKRSHTADMKSSDDWHGDGRNMQQPAASARAMRAQVKSHTGPQRDDAFSPGRSNTLRDDAQRAGYSHAAMQAAKKTGQYSVGV